MNEYTMELKDIFETANKNFIIRDHKLLENDAAERSLCGALAQILSVNIADTPYGSYHVDVDYNRNDGRVKEYLDEDGNPVTINCDLIIHSRGTNPNIDNLLAIEMKKSYRSASEKLSDKKRLIALTKDSYNNHWRADGVSLPKYVCGYALGVYYEINKDTKRIQIEYYTKGSLESKKEICF